MTDKITIDRAVVEQALEFIKATNESSSFWRVPGSELNKTVAALRAALSEAALQRLTDIHQEMEQPQPEPVAWMMVNPTHLPSSRSLHWEPQDWHITWQAVPLYTASPAPRRLTFQEIDEVCKSVDPGEIEWLWSDLVKFARAIEDRIRSKT